MADKTLASLTAATPATGGLLYGTQGGADRKFTLSAAGAALMEASGVIKLDQLAAPTDVTTLNATTSAHGLLPKLGGGTTNFLRADGAWAAPAGGGSALKRGMGVLQGNQVEYIPSTQPVGELDTSSWNPGDHSVITLISNPGAISRSITVSATDPADGSAWINTATFSNSSDLANALATLIGSYAEFSYSYAGGPYVNFGGNLDFGSTGTIAFSSTGVGITGPALVAGSDEVPASGSISEVILISKVTGKTLCPIRVGVFGNTSNIMNMSIALRVDSGPGAGSYNICDSFTVTTNTAFEVGGVEAPIATYMTEWISGRSNASLVAVLNDVEGGGAFTIWAIAEQF